MTKYKFHPGQRVRVSSGFGRPKEWEGTVVAVDPLWGGRKATGCYAVLLERQMEAVVRSEEEMEAVEER